ncbi:hypothetical protein HK405_013108 [Cladochytrium tenue]|nr:hypothetical protein HK405_013108 [Cladochytrium tenue]
MMATTDSAIAAADTTVDAAAIAAAQAAKAAKLPPQQHLDSAADSGNDQPAPVVPPGRDDLPEDQRALLDATRRLVADARRAEAAGDHEKAVEVLADASANLATVFGPNAPECAEVLLLYGVALFNNAVAKSSLLGGADEDAGGAGAAEDGAVGGLDLLLPSKPSSHFVFSGDEADDEPPASSAGAGDKGKQPSADASAAPDGDAANGDEEDEEEDESDIQIAWETLDLARTMFEKLPGRHAALRLADTLMALGDVSMEQGHWDKAIDDLERAVSTRTLRLPADHRSTAECLYKLALAYEFAGRLDDALDRCLRIRDILTRRRDRLAALAAASTAAADVDNGVGGDDTVAASPVAAKEEIEDIDALLPEIQGKIDDLKTQDDEARRMIREAFSSVASGLASASAPAGPATDVSGLVRPRPKPAPPGASSSNSAGAAAPESAPATAAGTPSKKRPAGAAASPEHAGDASDAKRPRAANEDKRPE